MRGYVFNAFVKKHKGQGLNEKEAMKAAYWDTFSGKMARDSGFTKMKDISGVKNADGDFTSIEAIVTQ